MAGEKTVKLHNRSERPDNIVLREHEVTAKCVAIEKELPTFMRGFFAYLKGNVLPMTRLAYLTDIRFFCQYLIDETALTGSLFLYPPCCLFSFAAAFAIIFDRRSRHRLSGTER